MVRSLRARNTHRHKNQAVHNTGGERDIYTRNSYRTLLPIRGGGEKRDGRPERWRERMRRKERKRETQRTREEEKRNEAREQDERWNDGDEVEEATADDVSGTSVVSRE